MCNVHVLLLLTLPGLVVGGVPRACARLARSHAPRYQLALPQGKTFRTAAIGGRPTQLQVWGGPGHTPAAAAAALLLVTLRYGLGYDAAFQQQHFDVCTANATQLSIAPVAYLNECPSGVNKMLWEEVSGGQALVPLRVPLVACVPSGGRCTYSALHDYEGTLRSYGLRLTLLNFTTLISELQRCNYVVKSCAKDEDQSERVVLIATRAAADGTDDLDYLRQNICKINVSLEYLLIDNTSCFFRVLRFLEEKNLPFLFLHRDLAIIKPHLLSALNGSDETARCLSRDRVAATDLVYRVGDGLLMKKYASQVADVVERFCPSLIQLQEVFYNTNGPNDGVGIERAACEWALLNTDTIESWIKNKKRDYGLYFYVCADEQLYTEFIRIIIEVNSTLNHDDFRLHLHIINSSCRSDQAMTDQFSDMIKRSPSYTMGVVAWSSSEGIQNIALLANEVQVPLILAGPITPETPTGPASTALNGNLVDVARFYRAFLGNCEWTRLAILSDESTYAKAFTNSLFHDDNSFEHIEETVTSKTVTETLDSLRAMDARVFIVNTNSSLAVEILQSALSLGMTPPQFAWMVREWSPTPERAAADWGDMRHFSLGTEWRGGAGDASEHSIAGNTELRTKLQALWPEATWPTLAAPLADAMLLLHNSFTIFQALYSTNSYSMHFGGYAVNFSEIYDSTKLPGIERELSFVNGTIETVLVYLDRWRGGKRTGLAVWDLRNDPHSEIQNRSLCGVRVPDRPTCVLQASGKGFVKKCYDIPLFSLFAVLAVLPVAFAAVRRARLKRLAVRDLNLLAHILESKQLTPVVHGDSLCMHKKIGTGNFGSVYLATLRQSKKKVISVAAKELRDESDKEEYLQEAGTLQQLDHENIVKFVGICVSNGSLLILMEYAFHGDLLQYLQARRSPVDEREAGHVSAQALTRMAREAALALQYLARCGLVHRDVRAANCLVDERRTLKLADFGLARKLCDNLEYTSIRRAMFPVLWMAPESLSRGTFSTASDMWALGVLCLELVTLGGRPYGTCSPQRVLAYVCHGGHPPLPPDASMQTVSLVRACWQLRPTARASAGDVAAYLAREPRALRPALQPPPPVRPDRTLTDHFATHL